MSYLMSGTDAEVIPQTLCALQALSAETVASDEFLAVTDEVDSWLCGGEGNIEAEKSSCGTVSCDIWMVSAVIAGDLDNWNGIYTFSEGRSGYPD